jgi:hypothetical protein
MFRRRFPVADMAPGPRATTGKELLGISEPLLSMRATAMRFGAMIRRSVEVARNWRRCCHGEEGMSRFFGSVTLSQACPGPTAILIDEFDAGGF